MAKSPTLLRRMPKFSLRAAALCLSCVCLLVGGTAPHPLAAQTEEKEEDLKQIRKQLERLRKQVEKDIRRRDDSTRKLREVEHDIAGVNAELLRIRTERQASERRQKALADQQNERRALIDAERASLAGQLRSAYINGRQERLKLALNQQDPARLGRLMVYYDYLNRYRAEKIATVTEHLRELDRLAAAAAAESARLSRLEEQRSTALATLEAARRERAQVVATLDRAIQTQGQEIARLKDEEQALEDLIEKLRRAMAEFPAQNREPFQSLQGKLPWPVRGKLLSDFGQPRAGGHLKWNGVLLEAGRGSEVRAIHHGRVAYADWLPGMGLLVVIEHGNGYMSLYGHNEVLFKAAGDWVTAGDVLATVGDSGGRPAPALYFEIRKGKRPLNPHRWISARL